MVRSVYGASKDNPATNMVQRTGFIYTPLQADIAAKWKRWESKVAALKSFAVPRYICSLSSKTLMRELVVFCDASEDANAAVAYMHAVLMDGEVICH